MITTIADKRLDRWLLVLTGTTDWNRPARNAFVRLRTRNVASFAAIVGILLGVNISAHGQLQSVWTQTYTSPRGPLANGLAVDAQSDVCVLADDRGAIAIVKYSSAGVPIWTNHFDSPFQDVPGMMAIDASNSVLVTGISTANGVPPIAFVLKYAPNGNLTWSHTGDVSNALGPATVTIDWAGNVWTATPTSVGYTFIKYTSEGTSVWTNSYGLQSGYSVRAFQADTNGNAALSATLSTIGQDQMLVLRCTAAGALTGTITTWAGTNDFLTAARFDASGNLCVAASVMAGNPLRYYLFVAKYDVAGTLLWSNLRPPANGHNSVSRQLAFDSAGNVIVTGYETQPVSEDEDESQTLTLKYSSSGNELWVARSGFERRPGGMMIDGNDNIVVTGDDTSNGSVFLLKYRPNGSQAASATASSRYFANIAASASDIYLNLGPGVETRKFVHTEAPVPLSAAIVPSFVEAYPGTSITFTAVVSGVGPFTYDWRYFGFKKGGTNSTFTVTNVQYQWGSQGDYTVFVSNATSYTISPEARLSILRVPTVQVTPTIQFRSAGEAAHFTATASGTEPFYFAWRKNSVSIPGENNSTLAFPNVQSTNAGNYSVIVTNRAGVITSSVVQLNVVLPPVSFTNAAAIQIDSNTMARPYPSDIAVSGVTGKVANLTATLRNVTLDAPDYLAVLLQAPSGAGIVLLSGVGSDSVANNLTLTFDDHALSRVPDEHLVSGTYLPTDYDCPIFPPPAQLTPRVRTLAELLAQNPNGVWRLFAINQYSSWGFPLGQIAGGWSLTFFLQDLNAVINTSLTRITLTNNSVVIEWDGAPGWKLQRSPSLANPLWTDVPGSEGQNNITLLMSGTNGFFRLLKP